jgi:ElaA protein
MNASIKAIREHYSESLIKISAQTYLKRFYNNLEFFEVGEEYLEDGIPHIAMIRS